MPDGKFFDTLSFGGLLFVFGIKEKNMKIFIALTILLAAGVAAAAWFFITPSLSRAELSEYAYDTLTLPDGMRVNYRTQGAEDAPVIVMAHGGSDSLGVWDRLAEELQGDYRIVRFDLPGHGLTDGLPPKEYSSVRLGEFIHDFVETAGLDDFVLVGHSFGGEGSLHYAVRRPEKIRALVLVASGGVAPTDEEIVGMDLKWLIDAPFWVDWLAIYHNPEKTLEGTTPALYHNLEAVTEADTRRVTRLMLYEGHRGGSYWLLANGVRNPKPVPDLETLPMPTLIMAGEFDRTTSLRMNEQFHAAIPNSELAVFKDTGHMITAEAPEKTFAVFQSFLNRLP